MVNAAVIILKDAGQVRYRSSVASLFEFQLLRGGVVHLAEIAVSDLLVRQDVPFLLERPELGRSVVPLECPS